MEKRQLDQQFDRIFPREVAEIPGYRELEVNTEKAIKNWLEKEAETQEVPTGNWLFYMDAAGKLHENPDWQP